MVKQKTNSKSAPAKKKAAPKKKSARKKAPAKKRVSRNTSVKTKRKSRKSSSTARGYSLSSKKKSTRKRKAPTTKSLSLHKDGTEEHVTSDEIFSTIINYGGRPSRYSRILGLKICAFISMGYSLRKICNYSDMPCIATVCNWLLDEGKSEFLEQYTLARTIQSDVIEDEIIDIADEASQPLLVKGKPIIIDGKPLMVVDNASVQHARLRVDTRTRHLEVVKPKKWGKAIDLSDVGGGLLALIDEAAERVANFKKKEAALIDNDSGEVVNA